MMSAVTVGLFQWVRHWALLLPTGLMLIGTTFHLVWCKRNGIDPIRATPLRRYYQLRGWAWRE
jgi:hypothetical protein